MKIAYINEYKKQEHNRKVKYIYTPDAKEILKTLTGRQHQTLNALESYCRKKNFCWPTVKDICVRMHLDYEKRGEDVRVWIKSLAEKNLITKEKVTGDHGGYVCNMYILICRQEIVDNSQFEGGGSPPLGGRGSPPSRGDINNNININTNPLSPLKGEKKKDISPKEEKVEASQPDSQPLTLDRQKRRVIYFDYKPTMEFEKELKEMGFCQEEIIGRLDLFSKYYLKASTGQLRLQTQERWEESIRKWFKRAVQIKLEQNRKGTNSKNFLDRRLCEIVEKDIYPPLENLTDEEKMVYETVIEWKQNENI